MKILNQTESLIFVIVCVLCFQRHILQLCVRSLSLPVNVPVSMGQLYLRPTGIQDVVGSTTAESAKFIRGD